MSQKVQLEHVSTQNSSTENDSQRSQKESPSLSAEDQQHHHLSHDPFHLLPAELHLEVFSHLSLNSILAIRLVSREFFYNSSTFFRITTTISKRCDSLQRLARFISDEAILLQHVKEIVWDTSEFVYGKSEDLENYIWGCLHSGHPFRDPQLVERDVLYADLTRAVGGDTVGDTSLWHTGVFQDMHEAEGYSPGLMLAGGIHKGFAAYVERYMEQERIKEDGLHFQMLKRALEVFKPKRVVVADFRELAGLGEGHHELCERLFGNVLQPEEYHQAGIDAEIREIQAIVAAHPNQQNVDVQQKV